MISADESKNPSSRFFETGDGKLITLVLTDNGVEKAKPIIKAWGKDQIRKKREECRIWWTEEKNKIQNFIKNRVIS